MKNKIIFVFIIIVILFNISGCKAKSAQATTENKITVYASFYPMYDFAKNIGKDRINLKLIIPSGLEPHDFEPSAKMIGNMEKADVFIYNGLEIEPWADKLIGSINNKNLLVVEASNGVKLLKNQGKEERHESDFHEGEYNHGNYDSHVWLDPTNALKQAENIKNALIKADEKNKDFYEANYKEFAVKLNNLDDKFKKELSDIKRNEIVTSHAAFGYLTNRYNLKQIAVSGLSPQEEPSSSKLAEITKIAKENNVKYIFFETLGSSKVSEVLANEIGAQTAVLNPIEGLTDKEIKSGKNYISAMEDNLKVLKKALGE